MSVKIRQFSDKDQEGVKDLILTGLSDKWGTLDKTLNPDLNDIAATYGSDNFLVAHAEGKLVATGGLVRETQQSVRVVRMWVSKDLRRSGIGSRMMNALLALAAKKQYARVVLETTATWVDAVSFYKKGGFIIEGHRDGDIHFYKDI